jgi:hypothetical protein
VISTSQLRSPPSSLLSFETDAPAAIPVLPGSGNQNIHQAYDKLFRDSLSGGILPSFPAVFRWFRIVGIGGIDATVRLGSGPRQCPLAPGFGHRNPHHRYFLLHRPPIRVRPACPHFGSPSPRNPARLPTLRDPTQEKVSAGSFPLRLGTDSRNGVSDHSVVVRTWRCGLKSYRLARKLTKKVTPTQNFNLAGSSVSTCIMSASRLSAG